MKTNKTHSLSWQNKLIATSMAVAMLLLGSPQSALAVLPSTTAGNLTVAAGTASATVTNSSSLTEALTITTGTQNTVLNWGSFSDPSTTNVLVPTDTITFTLPSGGAVLNNITGSGATFLTGHINSNGNVYFLNPNGIVVGNGASINVNGFYLSTVNDVSAPSYFYANGTLGVFNNVAQSATAGSGIVYIQSGANINLVSPSGTIGLASNYNGVSVTGLTGNVTSNGQGSLGITPTGINIDSLTTTGSLNIIGLNSSTAVTANGLVISQGYGTSGGLVGGNVTVTANSNFTTTGITSAGNLVINSGSGTIGLNGNVNVSGSATLTANNNISTGAAINRLNVNGNTVISAGAGSVTVNGDLIGGSTSITGADITLSDYNPSGAGRTLSQVTATGNLNVWAQNGITVSNALVSGNLTLNSAQSTAVLGSLSGAVSTVNGTTDLVTSNSGSTVYNTLLAGPATQTLTVSTANNALSASAYANTAANVIVNNVTINGSLTATASAKGTITLTGVTLSSLANAGIITATTNNGTIALSSITINNGYISATDKAGNNNAKSSITVTNFTNNSQVSGSTDVFTTSNGDVTLTNYQSVNAGLTVMTGVGTANTADTGDIKTSGANSIFGGPVSVTTNNGYVTLTGISVLGNVTNNALTITENTAIVTNNVTVTALTDLFVQSIKTGNQTSSSYTNVSVTSTGNLTLNTAIIAPVISLTAGQALTTNNVDVTAYSKNSITLSGANDLNTNSIANVSLNVGTLSITSTTGNVNVLNTNNIFVTSPKVTLTATTGNVNLAMGSQITTNGLTIVAGNSITENNGYGISNASNAGSATASLTAPTISLVGAVNNLPNITAIGGSNGTTINLGSTSNIASGTNVSGNLAITSNAAVVIGSTSTGTVFVGGTTSINTANSTTPASVSTLASNANLYGGVNITTNNASVALGVYAGNNNFGTVSISTGSSPQNVNIDENGVTNLGTVSASTLTVNANGIINSAGTVSATTANLNSAQISTTTVANNGVITSTTTTLPNSISVGTLNPSTIANINVINANAVTVNSNITANVNATNQYLNTLTLAANTGNLTYTGVGGSVGLVNATTTAGLLTYTTTNDPTTTGSLTTNTGGIVASASGSGGLGSLSYSLGNATYASKITSNAGITISNLTSLPASTASVTVTANAGGNVILGNGISLLGAGNVTFNSGNSQTGGVTVTGGISDAGTTGVTINSSVITSFVGKTISVTSPLNNIGGQVNLTSNGSINYTSNGSVLLGAVTIYNGASGQNTIQSLTGNISEAAGVTNNITSTSVNSPISFIASSTGNNGVVLANPNTINANPANVISISASGNSSLVNSADITLGNITVFPGNGQTPNTTDVQLYVSSTSGNISQKSGTSVYVWGNTTLNSKGTNGITLTNGGNNFGAITATATSSGNVKITESATSTYNSVVANNFNATSTYGDILTPTSNAAITVSGNSVLNANNIALTNSSDVLSGSNGTISITALGNANITQNSSTALIAAGTKVGGNLSITDMISGATISDQGSSTGLSVTGVLSVTANPSLSTVTLSSNNNTFGGLLTSAGNVTIYNKGNLVLLPGSNDLTAFITATGNISTSGVGGSIYTTLSLVSGGNVTITNDTKFLAGGALLITAPGVVNLSALSNIIDFNNGSIVPYINGLPAAVATPTYLPPSP